MDRDYFVGEEEFSDEDLRDMLEEAVAEGDILEDSPGYGIALKVLDSGWDSLSSKQQHIYEKYVLPTLQNRGRKLTVQRKIERSPE